MANQEKHPITFTCHNCNKKSKYPNAMTAGDTTTGAKTLVKKCTICGADNKIELPDGWVAKRTDTVLRGLRK